MLKVVLNQFIEGLAQVPSITHINTQNDYKRALKLIDELVDNYEANRHLIELLAISIGCWEDKVDEFTAFNKAVARGEPGITVLKTLMSQYHLGVADLPELGSKSYVSKLLNTAKDKKLTRQHIDVLSKRFDVSPDLFF